MSYLRSIHPALYPTRAPYFDQSAWPTPLIQVVLWSSLILAILYVLVLVDASFNPDAWREEDVRSDDVVE